MSPTASMPTPVRPPRRWNDFGGRDRLLARDVVRSLSQLFGDVLQWTGGAGEDALLANIRATLDTGGPESALPLDALSDTGAGRRELREQVRTISKQLLAWFAEDVAAAEPAATPPLFTRSHCDGHPWTPQVQHVLMGTRGGPEAMQGFNELLHQVVLLRDVLVPFTNWQQVPLLLDQAGGSGLRRLAGARDAFAVEVMMRQVRATAIVDLARRAVEIDAGPQGYAITSAQGVALPAVVGADVRQASTRLLTWYSPDAHGLPRPAAAAMFTYALGDYFTAPRTAASELVEPARPAGQKATASRTPTPLTLTEVHTGHPDTRMVRLDVATGNRVAGVDLGQALRGARYAYHVPEGEHTTADTDVQTLDLEAVLTAPGLVWASSGTWAVSARHDSTLALALLGKLYPENVVIAPHGSWGDLTGVGKDGTATFLVLDAAPEAAPSPPASTSAGSPS